MVVKEKKEVKLWMALLALGFLILAVLGYVLDGEKYGFPTFNDGPVYGFNNVSVQVPILLGIVFVSLLSYYRGYSWKELEEIMVNGVKSVLTAIFIVAIVGMIVGTWLYSGIIGTMVYYGLELLNPTIFLFAACILSSIVSICIGSSWTTVGTIGVALIIISEGLGVNTAMTAGAIVSGAWFGDKMSPLSDTTNISAALAGTDTFTHVKFMAKTTWPIIAVSLLIYLLMGFFVVDASNYDEKLVAELQTGIKAAYKVINPALLLIPLVTMVLAFKGLPAVPVLLISSILTSIVAIVVQGASIGEALNAIQYGYTLPSDLKGVSADVQDQLSTLFSRGGFDSMMWVISLILVAIIYGSLMSKCGYLDKIVSLFVKEKSTDSQLIIFTVLTSIIVNLTTAFQYMSITIPCNMYRKKFAENNLHPKCLSSALETGGTFTSPLIPWSACAATVSASLGVTAFKYFPYAFLLWLSPIFLILSALFLKSIPQLSPIFKMSNEEKEKFLSDDSYLVR